MITWTVWDSAYAVIDFFKGFPDSKTLLNDHQTTKSMYVRS